VILEIIYVYIRVVLEIYILSSALLDIYTLKESFYANLRSVYIHI